MAAFKKNKMCKIKVDKKITEPCGIIGKKTHNLFRQKKHSLSKKELERLLMQGTNLSTSFVPKNCPNEQKQRVTKTTSIKNFICFNKDDELALLNDVQNCKDSHMDDAEISLSLEPHNTATTSFSMLDDIVQDNTRKTTSTIISQVEVDVDFRSKNKKKTHRKTPNIEFYKISDGKILLQMQHPASIFFNGILNVSVIAGAVEVLGYVIGEESVKQTVFSPCGVSVLSLRTCRTIQKYNEPSTACLLQLGIKSTLVSQLQTNFENKKTILMVLDRDLDHSVLQWLQFLANYNIFVTPTQKVLGSSLSPYSKMENALQSLFETESLKRLSRRVVTLLEWESLAEEILIPNNMRSSRVILCGGKGVGKSTLLRYFANYCLRHYSQVLVVDFDPGQCEFTVPGCVSATLVDQPLLGPNFTHLRSALRSIFVGEIDVMQCPERYIQSVEQILEFCKSRKDFESIPWLVNTMGFSKGFGVVITSCVIQRACPTDIVQIESTSKKQNFPHHLTSKTVLSETSTMLSKLPSFLEYKLHLLPSAVDVMKRTSSGVQENHQWEFKPRVMREVVILSYISQMLGPQHSYITDVSPYENDLKNLEFEVIGDSMDLNQKLSVMNAALVALCSKADLLDQYPQCLGFGIVRGVDLGKGKLYLLAPNKLQLSQVNCLIKGTVSLPNCIYLESSYRLQGLIPYVDTTSTHVTNKIAKRNFRPPKQDKLNDCTVNL